MNLLMQGIEKSFGKNHVLKGVDFEVKTGEIHALVGENGAGKSTLMNILTGILEKDGGKTLDNEEFSFKKSTEALKKGIGFIHQELVGLAGYDRSRKPLHGQRTKKRNSNR